MDMKTQCVFMSGSRGFLGNTPDTKDTSTGDPVVASFSGSGSRGWQGNTPDAVESGGKGRETPQTRRTRPCGCRVLHVWVVEGVSNIPDTKDVTLWLRSLRLDGRRCRDTPDTKNATMWSHSSCLGW